MKMQPKKFTVHQFNHLFPNEDACLDYIKDAIYPDGIVCRNCDDTRHYRLSNRKAYSCQKCGTHVYPLAGTIFEKSSTPLKSWFYAMYLMASTRTGISAKQLERELGVTYKTAWRMFTQIRKLMANDGDSLFGQVEVDETYVGARKSGKRGRGAAGKTIVLGMAQRGGKAATEVVPDIKGSTILPRVQARIPNDKETTIFTDELRTYRPLTRMGYAHEVVQHSAKEYVNGTAHVNTVEALWSSIKRGIDGTHHAVSPKYLQSYLDAYIFRYNHRDNGQAMYDMIAGRVSKVRDGKLGSYSPLT